MNLVDPDILAEARGLPPVVPGIGLTVGLLLWVFGARSHRFWIALVITMSAGLLGLAHGPAYGMQPLVAGLLLAIAAGALALSLVRVLLFAAGGLAALTVMHTVAPNHDEPLVSFVVGGLGGILLYRFWITTLTSLIGTLLITYSGLCLLDRLHTLDAPAWSTRNAGLLNWGCAGSAVLGVLLQFLLDRRRKRKAKARKDEDDEDADERRHHHRHKVKPKATWWGWMRQAS
jgi:hypothetical protein